LNHGFGTYPIVRHTHIFLTPLGNFSQERHVAASAVQNEAAKVARGKAGQLGQRVYQSWEMIVDSMNGRISIHAIHAF